MVPSAESSKAGRGAPASFSPLLALLFPSRCGVCEAPRVDLGGGGVCRACWASLPVLDAAAACPRCALPAGGGFPCASCRVTPPAVARTAAFGLYAGGLRTLHHAFKFASWDLLASPLGVRLASLARATGVAEEADALVPVPSTRRRNRERGYDPAVLLADETGRRLGTPRRALLSRTRETPPQSSLSAPARRANVEGVFVASPRARGRVLVLVDDVVTTGATLFAAARALRAAGALEVRALVLARTPDPA
jgi:ComF family protein